MKYRMVEVGTHNTELAEVNKWANKGWRVAHWHVDDTGRSYYLMTLPESGLLAELPPMPLVHNANA